MGVDFKVYEHEHAESMVKLMEVLKLEKSVYIKNLVYKEKKKGIVMVVAAESTKVEFGWWREINKNPKKMRTATPA